MRILLLIILIHAGNAFGQTDPITSVMFHKKRNPAFMHASSSSIIDLQYQYNPISNNQSLQLFSEIGTPTSTFWQGSLYYSSTFPGAHKIELRTKYGRHGHEYKLHKRNRRYFGSGISLETTGSGRKVIPDINFGYFRIINNIEFGFSTSNLSRSIFNYDSLSPSVNLHGSYWQRLTRKWSAYFNGFIVLSHNSPLFRSELLMKQRWDKFSYGIFWQSDQLVGAEFAFKITIDKERTYFQKPFYLGVGTGFNYQDKSVTAAASLRIPLQTFGAMLSERNMSKKEK